MLTGGVTDKRGCRLCRETKSRIFRPAPKAARSSSRSAEIPPFTDGICGYSNGKLIIRARPTTACSRPLRFAQPRTGAQSQLGFSLLLGFRLTALAADAAVAALRKLRFLRSARLIRRPVRPRNQECEVTEFTPRIEITSEPWFGPRKHIERYLLARNHPLSPKAAGEEFANLIGALAMGVEGIHF